MAEGVSFKSVYKDAGCEPEVRRFVVDRDVSTSLTYLREKLVSIYPALRRKNFCLTWTDQDLDKVTIRSDDELIIALTDMKGPVYRVEVVADDEKDEEPAEGNQDGPEHAGVVCDGCDQPVVGFRYKCVTCSDYDLCGRCETKGLHPGHNMIRISSPEGAWPHHFYRRLHRMHDKMQKRSSSHGSCPAKAEQERHSSWETAPNLFGTRPAQERGPKPRPGGCRPTGPAGPLRQKWLDAMMKGWSGNEDEVEAHRAAHEAAHQAAMDAHQAAHDAAHEAAHAAFHQGHQPEAEYVHAGFSLPSPTEYLKNLGQMVASALDPLGVDVRIDVETPTGEMIKISGGEKKVNAEKAASFTESPKHEADMSPEAENKMVPKKEASEPTVGLATGGAGDREVDDFEDAIKEALEASVKAADDDNESNCSEISFVRKEDADDEDWTVVSQAPEATSLEASPEQGGRAERASPDGDEYDMPYLEDASVGSPQVEQKPEIVAPLEREESTEPTEKTNEPAPNPSVDPVQVWYASVNGTLYPDLPPSEPASGATSEVKPSTPVAIGDPIGAVGSLDRKLDKKIEKTDKKIEKLERKIEKLELKKSSMRPEPEPATHHDPRVQVALQAMLNMGFTNDGGWLTQLLEMKNGDIGKVLDVLSPVQPATRK